MKNILLFLFLPLFLGACGDDDNTLNGPDENDNINWYAAADSSTTALVNSFWNAGGKYFNYDSNGNTTFHYSGQTH